MQWQRFETDCTNYLNQHFREYASFVSKGGSDSTMSDIKVTTKTGNTFFIEAKLCPAQCGQFVLLPDFESSRFNYSEKNATGINPSSKMIIEYMNQHFEEFKEAGTAGKKILMDDDQDIFSKWIIDYYKDKDIKYIITNHYIILPIEELNDYFYITSEYRIKRSGSSNVSKRNISNVIDHIHSNDYIIENTRQDNSKLFVESSRPLHNERFLLRGYEYMFSSRDSQQYEVRKLSNTFNANVIFSINLKPNKKGMSPHEFIRALK